MKNNNELPEFLTDDELESIGTLLVSKQVPLLEPPVRAVERRLGKDGMPVPGEIFVWEQRGWCKLSDDTRRRELDRIEKFTRKRKALRQRKKYTRKRGTVHPKKKLATERRRRERLWATKPLACVIHMNRYKCKDIDATLWDKYVTPLWVSYDPKELTVEFPSTAGTRREPWTIYNMVVKHNGKVIYNGEDQLIYDLSSPGRASPIEEGGDR